MAEDKRRIQAQAREILPPSQFECGTGSNAVVVLVKLLELRGQRVTYPDNSLETLFGVLWDDFSSLVDVSFPLQCYRIFIFHVQNIHHPPFLC